MKIEIKVPAMGESITEATIGTIIKPTGSAVKADDEVLELETDKVNQVLYAPQAGVITIQVKPEQVVKIGDVIGYVDTEGAAVSQSKETPAAPPPKEELASPKETPPPPREAPVTTPTKPIAPPKAATPQTAQAQSPSLSPPGDPTKEVRLTKERFLDDLAAKEASPSASEPSHLPPKLLQTEVHAGTAERPVTRKKLSKIRKVIAQRLLEAQHSTAMLTTFNEVDMTAVMGLREKYKEAFTKEHGVKLGFMSFFVKAVVYALMEVPEVNAYIENDEFVQREYLDIGIAVGTERGLVVPVVRACDKLSFAGIEKAIEGYAVRAKEGKLAVDDLTGGCFTITNGGTYGSLMSTPILNPPQSAILGMHKIQKRPVVVNDQIVIRPMMYLALSYDHRVIDGKEAVTFLVHIKNCLEEPSRLLLEV